MLHESKIEQAPGVSERGTMLIHAAVDGGCMAAEELRQELMRAVSQNDIVTLDVSQLDHVNAAALQVLLAFRRQREVGDLCLIQVSASLASGLKLAGVADELLCREMQ